MLLQLKDLLDNNGDKNQPSYELPDLPVQNILDVAEYVGAKIELEKRKKDISKHFMVQNKKLISMRLNEKSK